jgi:hypothetical protein
MSTAAHAQDAWKARGLHPGAHFEAWITGLLADVDTKEGMDLRCNFTSTLAIRQVRSYSLTCLLAFVGNRID